jgi:CDP-ribitol ribitolphosphotransferase
MHLQRQEKETRRFLANFLRGLPMMFRQMRALATARVAVMDGYVIPVSILNHRKELTCIQIWHAAAAIKQFGRQTLPVMSARERNRDLALKMHEGYTLFTAPSAATRAFFAEGFGMPESKGLITGTPYFDMLHDGEYDKAAAIRAVCPDMEGKAVVLYAPTYRAGASERTARAAAELAEALRGGDIDLRVRLHPVDGDVAGMRPDPLEDFTTEELLSAADALITDYSALAVAAAAIGVPLYFYVYDIEAYRRSPGLNVDPESEYPRYTSRNALDLARMVRAAADDDPYDRAGLAAFANRYVECFDGGCTRRLADLIMEAVGDGLR